MTRLASTPPWLLARFAQGAIAVAGVAEVFRAVAVRAHHLHPSDAPSRDSGLGSMVFVYVMTGTFAVFLTWFSRCWANARALSSETETETETETGTGTGTGTGMDAVTGSGTWAVVAWLVPLVNLWAPRRLVLAVDHANAARGADQGRGDLLVNVWWSAWTGYAVVTVVSQTGQGTSMPLLVASGALDIAAAVLAILVIQRITAGQGAALRADPAVEPLTPA
ncbi:DUF4328 domain-containing protein [Streptomyces sp. NPDC087843]|uniref:DUF4328 domain-containing protein n=1 Tax=Streptomyces sp. NPDC087843 TaxID=3365804 RepID=UPI00381753CF